MDGFDRVALTYDRYRVALERARQWVLVAANLSDGLGRSAVDLGTGTGAMAVALSTCRYHTVGVDSAQGMLERAVARPDTEGVDFVHAPAWRTGLASGAWDLITASQSWHLFDAPLVIPEVNRLLSPNGRLLIAAFDWVSTPGSIVDRSENIIREMDAAWAGPSGDGRHPSLLARLHDTGFKHQKVGEQIFNATYTTQDWLGRLATSSAVGAHPDAQKAELLLRRLSDDLGEGSEEHVIEHRAWWVLARPSA